MAESDILKKSDFVEDGAIKEALSDPMLEFAGILDSEVQPAIIKFANTLNAALKGFKIEGSTVEDIKKINVAIKESSDLLTVNNKVQKTKQELTAAQIAQAQIDKQNKKDEITLLKATIIELDKTAGSLQRVEAANTRLRLERKALNTDTAEGKKRLAELNAEIDKNNKYIIENSDKLKQQKLNVGNYTESIEKAFTKTGLFGHSIETLTAIYESVNEIVEIFKARQEAATAATEAATAAEETNTAATEANVIAAEADVAITDKEIVAKELDATATEADTAATELNTTANKANSLSKLGLVGGIIIAVAALGALGLAYKKSTQEGKDDVDVALEMAEMAKRQAGTIAKYREEIFNLLKEEKALHDERTANAADIQKLETEAAKARAEAQDDFIIDEKNGKKEINTTANKISLLKEYVDALTKVKDIKTEEAEKDYKNAQALANIFKGTSFQREYADKASEALVALRAIEENFANETRRARKQLSTLAEKDFKDRLDILQDAEKKEIESVGVFNEDKYKQAKEQFDKDVKLNDLETKQALENEKRKQAELGEFDADGISHAAEFQRELTVINDSGKAKDLVAYRKYLADIKKLDDEAEKERIEALTKRIEENTKQSEKDFKLLLSKIALQEQEQINKETDRYIKANDFSEKAKREHEKKLLDIALYYIDLDTAADEDNLVKKEENEKKKLALINKYNEAGIKEAKDTAKELKKIEDEITKGIQDGLDKRYEIQQQADQKDIDFHNRMIEVQAKLAAEGKDNILAEEQARADKAEEKKLQDAKKAAKLQEDITIIKTFSDTLNQALEKNEPFLKAFGEATAASGLVTATFARLFSGFFEGTEDTGTVKNPLDNKGGRLIIAHDNERIVPKKLNDKLAGMSNEDLINNALAFENIYLPNFKASNVSTTVAKEQTYDVRMTEALSKKFDELKTEIANKPVQQVNLNALGEVTEKIIRKGLTHIIHHKKNTTRPSLRLNG